MVVAGGFLVDVKSKKKPPAGVPAAEATDHTSINHLYRRLHTVYSRFLAVTK